MDESILLFLQDNVRCDFLTPIMKVVTVLAGYGGAFFIAMGLMVGIIKKTRWVGITFLTSMALSGIFTNLLLKKIVNRPRPYTMITGLEPVGDRPTDASFPSGHTAVAFCVATVMVLTLPWIIEKTKAHLIGALFVVLALVISFSRLYLGVHYPTDVFCGIMLGITYGVVATMIVRAIKKRIEKPKEEDSV